MRISMWALDSKDTLNISGSRTGILKVWVLDQQRQRNLRAQYKCMFSDSTSDPMNCKLGVGAPGDSSALGSVLK